LRDQLNSVWRQTGIKPKELEQLKELPESCVPVWKWFIDLNNSRSSNGFGVNPLSYSDIKAYLDLIGVEVEEWELYLIKRIDNEALNSYSKEAESERKRASKK
jgi:hypothetical protein